MKTYEQDNVSMGTKNISQTNSTNIIKMDNIVDSTDIRIITNNNPEIN